MMKKIESYEHLLVFDKRKKNQSSQIEQMIVYKK